MQAGRQVSERGSWKVDFVKPFDVRRGLHKPALPLEGQQSAIPRLQSITGSPGFSQCQLFLPCDAVICHCLRAGDFLQ